MTPHWTPSERCPFCGTGVANLSLFREPFFVVCKECGCSGPSMATPEGAVTAWDARSNEPLSKFQPQPFARAISALVDVDRQALASAKKVANGLRSIEQTLSLDEAPTGDGTAFGEVQCHCSDDDGVPDIGVSVGLGAGKVLWLGELRLNEGGDIGLALLGPGDERIVAPLWPDCEWQEAVSILRHHVGPALVTQTERCAMIAETMMPPSAAAGKIAAAIRALAPQPHRGEGA